MSINYGSKRLVVGAHYGLRDWLSQRITAILIALFALVLMAQVCFTKGPIDYAAWRAIFDAQWMRLFAFVTAVAVLWHAWVGVRDIWMDYVPAAGLRLFMDVLTIVWLVGCAGWVFQILWRL
ncbi:succinate dehydrogenase, hydrophobic membrane anchor protein [Vandammella animalimorsus]|uniref:Succinate dehydrogenase hydrophobic membrane anchor subunit n=1 Tax=Vandammella animalimorsus TaxID=2029117 RepID=A0A2A2A8K7_9BURK|nr:succinate dehydrogenase, hydrophobic membrane anchor protein [Vandammella animalimorsus]PAT34133.1 succinate dehydrogenase, hydrophobic membrane anchor protein [Vandammella animalimorsus]PAT38188.1 succinate dehydrogenase, hydrophobic membrane anchor protein [Vandammella animalimorsus]PAT39877.1 succinate dehydrogenase, hydrophobic membrane anchor protein [Vandammella animalimorsus]